MTTITFDELSSYFDMRLEDACNQIKLSSTSMKKLCREFNVQRWPYRKLKSLYIKKDKLSQQLKEMNADSPGYDDVRYQIQQVDLEVHQIKTKPEVFFDSRTVHDNNTSSPHSNSPNWSPASRSPTSSPDVCDTSKTCTPWANSFSPIVESKHSTLSPRPQQYIHIQEPYGAPAYNQPHPQNINRRSMIPRASAHPYHLSPTQNIVMDRSQVTQRSTDSPSGTYNDEQRQLPSFTSLMHSLQK
ncbi:hypothetical protein AKO1_011364 [Acrasis kona]|uniref:RWP-RK domain-containing protein n=1 Tax=Acrasis kona TaxID=1008807 RepID=A0AAW2YXV5_9EUKA